MSEDKIDLGDIPVRYLDNQQQRFASLGDIAMLITEVYRQAQIIGWETKVLDPLVEKLTNVRKFVPKP